MSYCPQEGIPQEIILLSLIHGLKHVRSDLFQGHDLVLELAQEIVIGSEEVFFLPWKHAVGVSQGCTQLIMWTGLDVLMHRNQAPKTGKLVPRRKKWGRQELWTDRGLALVSCVGTTCRI